MHNHLMELQVRRKFYIRLINMQTNASKALVRRAMGWRSDDEEERTKINAKAAKIISKAMKGDLSDMPALALDLEVIRKAIEPLQQARDDIEREMKKLAASLPVWAAWGKSVGGFGELGLAVVIGEAGDLSGYPNPAKLWKRLGLAPYQKDGTSKAMSTWRKFGGLTTDEWASKETGYSPRRLGQVFGVVTEPLMKHKAKSKYGLVYQQRRKHTAETHPDWTDLHSHKDAMRIMTKELIRDLWSEWQRANSRLQPMELMPAAPSSGDEPGRQAKVGVKPSAVLPDAKFPEPQAMPASEPPATSHMKPKARLPEEPFAMTPSGKRLIKAAKEAVAIVRSKRHRKSKNIIYGAE